MDSWLTGWRNRLAKNVLPLVFNPRVRTSRFGYESAGLTVCDEPIPWNAGTVLVEFVVQHPAPTACDPASFRLQLARHVFESPARIEPGDEATTCRVLFRIPPIPQTTLAALHWRGWVLGHVVLPHLSAETFLGSLRLESPSVLAHLGEHDVACRALVAGQAARVAVCGLLKSPTSLLPLVNAGLTLELRGGPPGLGRLSRIPVRLTPAQVTARQALVSVAVWPDANEPGAWSLRWLAAGRALANQDFRVISRQDLHQSLYLAPTLFPDRPAEEDPAGDVSDAAGERTGPCVRLASREPGIAALCPLEVHVRYRDPARPADRLRKEVLVTDVPSLSLSVPVPVEDLRQVDLLEVYHDGRSLGRVVKPVTPVATFTSEGGFHEPAPFEWNAFAEEEMEKKLLRLLEMPAN